MTEKKFDLTRAQFEGAHIGDLFEESRFENEKIITRYLELRDKLAALPVGSLVEINLSGVREVIHMCFCQEACVKADVLLETNGRTYSPLHLRALSDHEFVPGLRDCCIMIGEPSKAMLAVGCFDRRNGGQDKMRKWLEDFSAEFIRSGLPPPQACYEKVSKMVQAQYLEPPAAAKQFAERK